MTTLLKWPEAAIGFLFEYCCQVHSTFYKLIPHMHKKTHFPASHLVAAIENKRPTCFSGFESFWDSWAATLGLSQEWKQSLLQKLGCRTPWWRGCIASPPLRLFLLSTKQQGGYRIQVWSWLHEERKWLRKTFKETLASWLSLDIRLNLSHSVETQSTPFKILCE